MLPAEMDLFSGDSGFVSKPSRKEHSSISSMLLVARDPSSGFCLFPNSSNSNNDAVK